MILLEKHYHKAVDIWALGIIIYEMFKYISEKREHGKSCQVFQAKRCFPLTPDGVVWDQDGLPQTDGDLLDSIFDLIGTPQKEDWKFISDNFAIDYLKKFKVRPPRDLYQELPNIEPEGIKLLQSIL